MTNRAIEFHDSRVERIEVRGSTCQVQLSAYIHESDGIPGSDPGSGWVQPMVLTVRDAQLDNPLGPDDDRRILEGLITVDAERFDNILPLPFARTGQVRLELTLSSRTVVLCGSHIAIESAGVARFVEAFRLR